MTPSISYRLSTVAMAAVAVFALWSQTLAMPPAQAAATPAPTELAA